MEPRELLDILCVAERLKNETRHSWTSQGRRESVAEHTFSLALMSFLIRDEFPDADMDRVTKMCLIHDLGECFIGDIPSFNKTKADEAREEEALAEWVKTLPAGLSEEMAALYAEMDALETKEARIYKSLDKLDAVIQHNAAPLDTWTELEHSLNKTYAFDNVAFSDWLTRLRKEILADTLEKLGETE